MKRWERLVEGGQENLFTGKGSHRVMPHVPPSDWKVKPFPNLKHTKRLAIDIETNDPDLKTKGPGFRRDAYIVGIAVATEDEQWYFPMRHNDRAHCLDPDTVLRWARDNLCEPNQTKIGANILYDLDGLWTAGVPVTGPYYDVQYAEPLLDEYSRTSLEALANKYTGAGKESNLMYEWSARAFGGKPDKSQAKNIWRCPASLVGPYAESDVRLPFEILAQQMSVLVGENLEAVYELECGLIPMLLAMRLRGVRVDTEAAEIASESLLKRAAKLRKALLKHAIDPNSPDTIKAYCDKFSLNHPLTDKGNPSFTSPWLESHKDPVLRGIYETRKLEKHEGTFLRGTILGNAVSSRIHCQFNPLRGDDTGAVSGRFSSSDPNLQNIPARDKELGPLLRAMFVPDQGQIWRCDDWRSIEFRLLVHYAMGRGSERARQAFALDPLTDFHEMVAKITGIPRKPAKNINFGLVYGMGKLTMARNMGKSLDEIQPMFDIYHEEFPFVRQTFKNLSDRANSRGYIITHYGRRRRFDRWESRNWEDMQERNFPGLPPPVPLPYDEAVTKWGERGIRRAMSHKALNALLQGSAADIMKLAMKEIWDTGICDVLGPPLLTVHDELNWSSSDSKECKEAHSEAIRIMENCVELRVPLRVSSNTGANWDEAK